MGAMNYVSQIQTQSLSLGQPSLDLDPDPYWLLECELGATGHKYRFPPLERQPRGWSKTLQVGGISLTSPCSQDLGCLAERAGKWIQHFPMLTLRTKFPVAQNLGANSFSGVSSPRSQISVLVAPSEAQGESGSAQLQVTHGKIQLTAMA